MESRSAKLARLEAVRSRVPHVSRSALAALLRVAAKEGPPDIKDVSRFHVAEARDRVAFMDTPYGPLHQHIDVGGVKVETQHPAAAMCAFCGASRALSALMSETAGRLQPTPAEPWRILLYLDEISPGNQLAYTNIVVRPGTYIRKRRELNRKQTSEWIHCANWTNRNSIQAIQFTESNLDFNSLN